MTPQMIAHLTHEARLKIAADYMEGKCDHKPLNGVMIRLILQSLCLEHEQELPLRSATET